MLRRCGVFQCSCWLMCSPICNPCQFWAVWRLEVTSSIDQYGPMLEPACRGLDVLAFARLFQQQCLMFLYMRRWATSHQCPTCRQQLI